MIVAGQSKALRGQPERVQRLGFSKEKLDRPQEAYSLIWRENTCSTKE